MGISERRKREKLKRREEILDAAETIFFSKGISESTMDQVAEEAELSKGTLYLYFKNKEDLYFGITERALNLLTEEFSKSIDPNSTGLEQVKQIGQAYYKYSFEHNNYFNTILKFDSSGLEIMKSENMLAACHDLGQKVNQLVIKALQKGIEDGSIRKDIDPVKTAFILQGQSSGIFQLIAREKNHLENWNNLSIPDILEEFTKMMVRSLGNQ